MAKGGVEKHCADLSLQCALRGATCFCFLLRDLRQQYPDSDANAGRGATSDAWQVYRCRVCLRNVDVRSTMLYSGAWVMRDRHDVGRAILRRGSAGADSFVEGTASRR